MAEKVTTMVLKVDDLHCPRCYKKIKKLLCKFPQIRDQIYDEKQNTVTITVVCCDPHMIRTKLCSKGGKTIKSIEIKEPKPDKKPKEPEPKPVDKKPPASDSPALVVVPVLGHRPVGICCGPCYGSGVPCNHVYGRPCCGNCAGGYGLCYCGTSYVSCDYFSVENPSGCRIM